MTPFHFLARVMEKIPQQNESLCFFLQPRNWLILEGARCHIWQVHGFQCHQLQVTTFSFFVQLQLVGTHFPRSPSYGFIGLRLMFFCRWYYVPVLMRGGFQGFGPFHSYTSNVCGTYRGITDTRVVGMPSHLLLYACVSTVLASVMIGVAWHRVGFTVTISGHMMGQLSDSLLSSSLQVRSTTRIWPVLLKGCYPVDRVR